LEYAFITGASSGIGRAIALELAALDHGLILHGRNTNRLKEVQGACTKLTSKDVKIVCADLSTTAGIATVVATAKAHEIAVLVNNAGSSCWDLFHESAIDEQLNMVRSQLDATMELCHACIPPMMSKQAAYILNVSSTTIYQPIPTMAAYGAVKSYIRYFSRALRYELKDSSVSVTTLVPGPTRTRFMERANMEVLNDLAEKFSLSSETVAKKAVKGMLKGKAEIVPGPIDRITAAILHFLPTSLTTHLAGNIYLKKLAER